MRGPSEAGPVEVDQGEAIVGLIQRHVTGFIRDIILNGELGVILDVDDRGFGCPLSWMSVLSKVLLNKLLVADLVDEVLTEGCHDDGDVEACGEDGEQGD